MAGSQDPAICILGGRYRAMWATDGYTNGFGTGCPCQTLPARIERYGGFLQASYKLNGIK
jgi:hypothetical protein